MRFIQLDQELFMFKLDYTQYTFYLKHRDVMKKFWTDQGQTFWLRVLVTFKMSFEVYVSKHSKIAKFLLMHYKENISDFIYAQIHKHFVENTFVEVDAFLDSVFTTLQLNNNAPVTSHSEHCYSLFCEALKHRDSEKFMYDAVLTLSCIMLCGFIDGFLLLLKKWLQEPDLSKKAERNIDLTVYYWRPMNNWEGENYDPCCFEKYLSTYWKETLPKLLLTCNIHNIFNTHVEQNGCCSKLQNKLSPFGILLNYQEKKTFQLNVLFSIKPGKNPCEKHKNCSKKIIHLEECTEPCICIGQKPCYTTCVTTPNIVGTRNYKEFWKEHFVQVFKTKRGKKRHVSTLTESYNTPLVTFSPASQSKKKVCHDLEDLFCSAFDSNLRNSYSQHKRKEDCRQKLRKKLQEKSTFDFQDSKQLLKMHMEAQRKFLSAMCCDNFKEIFSSGVKPFKFDADLFKLKKSVTSVAVGTSDIIFGQVVLPSKGIVSQMKKCTVNQETITSLQLPIKSSSKKKKINKTKVSCCKSDIKLNETVTKPPTVENPPVESWENNDEFFIKYSPNSGEAENKTPNGLTMEYILNLLSTDESESTDIPAAQGCVDTVPELVDHIIKSDNACEAEMKTPEDIAMDYMLNLLSNDETQQYDIPAAQASVKAVPKTHNKLVDQAVINPDLNSQEAQLSTELEFDTHMGTNLSLSSKSKTNSAKSQDIVKYSDIDDGVSSGEELDDYMKFISGNDSQADSITEKEVSANVSETLMLSSLSSNKTKISVLEQDILKSCAYCLNNEVLSLTFKMCSKCKEENSPKKYYYCSKACQVADWTECHKYLHHIRNIKK